MQKHSFTICAYRSSKKGSVTDEGVNMWCYYVVYGLMFFEEKFRGISPSASGLLVAVAPEHKCESGLYIWAIKYYVFRQHKLHIVSLHRNALIH